MTDGTGVARGGEYFGELVLSRYVGEPIVPARQIVPDGDPCPIDGLPTRLQFIPGAGPYSQCPGCVDRFLAWFGSIEKGTRIDIRRPAPPQGELAL
jgi:hypothetical protein